MGVMALGMSVDDQKSRHVEPFHSSGRYSFRPGELFGKWKTRLSTTRREEVGVDTWHHLMILKFAIPQRMNNTFATNICIFSIPWEIFGVQSVSNSCFTQTADYVIADRVWVDIGVSCALIETHFLVVRLIFGLLRNGRYLSAGAKLLLW